MVERKPAPKPAPFVSDKEAGDFFLKREKVRGKDGQSLSALLNTSTVPSGMVMLDVALGCRKPGIPRGVHIEIFGPESSGKTLLAAHLAAQFQRFEREDGMFGRTCIADFEGTMPNQISLLEAMGVSLDPPPPKGRCYYEQFNYAEPGFDILYNEYALQGRVDNILVDSIGGMEFEESVEKDLVDDEKPGLRGKFMARTMRRFNAICNQTGLTMFWVNHIYDKINSMTPNSQESPGGRALKFFSSIRIKIRGIKKIIRKNEVAGLISKVEVVKNKLGPAFRSCNVVFDYQRGLDPILSMLYTAKEAKWIKMNGSYWNFEDLGVKKQAQGDLKARDLAEEEPKILENITARLDELVKINVQAVKDSAEEEDPDEESGE